MPLVRFRHMDKEKRDQVLQKVEEQEQSCIAPPPSPRAMRNASPDPYALPTATTSSAATSAASSGGSGASSPRYMERVPSERCSRSGSRSHLSADEIAARITPGGIGGAALELDSTPPASFELVKLVKALWPESEAGAGPLPPKRERMWGHLLAVGGNPPLEVNEYELKCAQEYMVGRSRKSDIRIGHTAPMPYISGQHFRLFHELGWPSVARRAEQTERGEQTGDAETAAHGAGESSTAHGGGSGPLGIGGSVPQPPLLESTDSNDTLAPSNPSRPPPELAGPAQLEAWLEDLSQNGTFVNGLLVGKGQKRRLRHGDSIELVFPAATQAAQQLQTGFPNFFFYSPRPKLIEVAVQTEP